MGLVGLWVLGLCSTGSSKALGGGGNLWVTIFFLPEAVAIVWVFSWMGRTIWQEELGAWWHRLPSNRELRLQTQAKRRVELQALIAKTENELRELDRQMEECSSRESLVAAGVDLERSSKVHFYPVGRRW
jgi:hypothetical protein